MIYLPSSVVYTVFLEIGWLGCSSNYPHLTVDVLLNFQKFCLLLQEYLVGGWPTPLKNMKASWDDDSQYMEKCSKPPTRYIHTCTYNRVLGIPVCHKGFLWKKIVQVRFSRGFATAKEPPSARSFGWRLLVLTHARCGYADVCFQQSPLGVF